MKLKLFLTVYLLLGASLIVEAQNKLLNSPARKLQLAEFAIANLYVDDVDEDKLVEDAIIKMLEELDPHSTYSNPEEVKKLNEYAWNFLASIQKRTKYRQTTTLRLRNTK